MGEYTSQLDSIFSSLSDPIRRDILQRAWIYQRLVGVYMIVDHFENHKTSFEEARETFDRVKDQSDIIA